MEFWLGALSHLSLAWSSRVRQFEFSSNRVSFLRPPDRNHVGNDGFLGRSGGAEEAIAAARSFGLYP